MVEMKEAETDTLSRSWARNLPHRIGWKRILIAFVLAEVVMLVVALLVGTASRLSAESRGENLTEEGAFAILATIAGTFIGYFLAGVYLGKNVERDPLLHVIALFLVGVLAALVLTLLDVVLGFPIEGILPGKFHDRLGVAQYVLSWPPLVVALPSAAMGCMLMRPRNADHTHTLVGPESEEPGL